MQVFENAGDLDRDPKRLPFREMTTVACELREILPFSVLQLDEINEVGDARMVEMGECPRLYFLKTSSSVLTVLDARSGEVVFTEKRVDGLDNIYSSIVGAAGKVYLTGRNGMTVVLREGTRYGVLAQNRLDEGFEASLAIAGKEIFLRGPHRDYCIAEQEERTDGGR